MLNIFRKDILIASVLAVVGTTAFVGKANAQSVPVDFNGTIPNACQINKLTDGALTVVAPKDIRATTAGTVTISCTGTGAISVSATSYTAPTNAGVTDTSGWVEGDGLSDGSVQRNVSSSGLFGTSATSAAIAFNGASKTYSVYGRIYNNNAALPVGTYTFRTTVNITAQ
jgi:hypothetical protein